MSEKTINALGNYIDGRFRHGENPDEEWTVQSPADLKDTVFRGSTEYGDIDRAVHAAKTAYLPWAHLGAEKRKEHLAKIIGQIQLLTEMMEDINFIILASFEELTIKTEPDNLKQLCETIVGELQTSGSIFHRIEFVCDEGIPQLTLDLRRIKYVIMNVLSNAMKYSDEDTIVTVSVEQQDDEVVIRVEDEGIGISAEEQARIFEPFYRGHNVGVIRGTGIGLSIVKEIVDQHNGTIHLDSELGRGTKVRISLPISVPPKS